MTCACGKVALYRVGAQGFCRAHYEPARAAASAEVTRRLAMQAAETGHFGNYPSSRRRTALRLSTFGGYGSRGR